MGRPSANPESFESGAQPAVGIAELFGVNFCGAQENGAANRAAVAGKERVGRPKGAKIANEREHVGVARDDAVAVDDRQRQAGALQERSQRANVGERRYARRCAAENFAFGDGQRVSQLKERVAAGERGDDEPVRLQRQIESG